MSVVQFVILPLMLVAIPAVFMWLWDKTMPDVFGLRPITYWQSLRLLLIAGFLFAPEVIIDFSS
jgi:hypothetical protein